jgi:hypothetical protein
MRLDARLIGTALACVLGLAVATGCQSSGQSSGEGTGILRAGIAPAATVVAEGSTQLTYTPEEPGQVSIYSVTEDRVIGRYYMRRGQRFAMDGTSGRATIDGNEVRIAETKKNGSYQVFFVPAPVE